MLNSLGTVRDRSRQAYRDDGYARGGINSLVTNIVGTGIKPMPLVADPDIRRALTERFLAWTDEADAEGVLDFFGLQTQSVRGWLEAGEQFVIMRPRLLEDGLTVPLQLQMVEPELCPHTYNITLPNGHKVKAGIEHDLIGRRVAYYFHSARTSHWSDIITSELRRVPAELVIHLYEPLRAGQLRGIPQIQAALIRLRDLAKYDDATLLRQQVANLFAGFIKRRPGDTQSTDPLTGQAIASGDTAPLISLEPGLMQELQDGEEIEWSDPPDVPSTYEGFMRQQLYAAATAIGLPYELLTGDLSKINDRTIRVVLNEFRRRIQAWQHQIVGFQLGRRVYNFWLDRGFLAGTLPLPGSYATDPGPWRKVKWMPQRWQYIHPVQDVQAAKDEVTAGFASRSAAVSERGEDAEQIDNEQAADNARADRLGLIYESDGRHAKASAPAPTAEPEPETTPATEGEQK